MQAALGVKNLQVIQSRKPMINVKREHLNSTLFIFSIGLALLDITFLPPYYIIHQTEQAGCPALKFAHHRYHAILKNALWVWDYSQTNIELLLKLDKLKNISFCPFSYYPSLEVCQRLPIKYDILFMGTLCKRRVDILDALRSQGLIVKICSKTFGQEKHRLIMQSKIVLNLHYYVNPSILETERLGLLLANRCCVVSETSSETLVDEFYSNGVVFAQDTPSLIFNCQHLLSSPELIEDWRERSYQWFKQSLPNTFQWDGLNQLI